MRSSRSGEVPRARTRVARCYLVCLRGVIAVVNATLVALIMVVLAAVAVRYLGVFAGSLHWATEFGRFAITDRHARLGGGAPQGRPRGDRLH